MDAVELMGLVKINVLAQGELAAMRDAPESMADIREFHSPVFEGAPPTPAKLQIRANNNI